MKIVRAYRLGDGGYSEYKVPSRREAIAHSEKTWGRSYDRGERREVEGGIAMLWERIDATALPSNHASAGRW